MMNRIFSIISIYLILFSLIIVPSFLGHAQTVSFIEKEIEKEVRELLNVSTGTSLTIQNLESIEVLNLRGLGLKTVTDLNLFKNLKYLDISDNFINSICSLKDLKFLYYLNLEDNLLSSIDCLTDFSVPVLMVRCSGNKISNFIRVNVSTSPEIFTDGRSEQFKNRFFPEYFIFDLNYSVVSFASRKIRINFRCLGPSGSFGSLKISSMDAIRTRADGVGGSIEVSLNSLSDFNISLVIGSISKTITGSLNETQPFQKYNSPSLQATAFQVNNRSTNSLTISWIRGNGSSCIVTACPSTSNVAHPLDGSDYLANTNYGLASSTSGDTKVLYKGTGNSLTISGLQPNTSYKIFVYEYNGNSPGEQKYLKTPLCWDVGMTNEIPFVRSDFSWNGYPLANGIPYQFFNTSENANTFRWTVSPTATISNFQIANPTLNFPASGDYNVTLQASNSTNSLVNSITKKVTILNASAALPDASIRNIRLNPLSVIAGQSVTVTCEAVNLSNFSGVTNAEVQYVISDDDNIDPNDWYSGIQQVSLQPGQMKDINHTFSVPINFSGNKRLLIRIDNKFVIPELNENNNIGSAALNIVGAKCDLSLTSLSINPVSPLASGQKFAMSFNVQNSGQIANTNNAVVRLFISRDAQLDPLDFEMNSLFTVFSYQVFQGKTQFFITPDLFKIPDDWLGGNYFLIAAIDYNFKPGLGYDANIELNETNNTISIPVSISNPGQPTTQISNLLLTRTGQRSVRLNWANGNGNTRIVLGRKSNVPHYPRDGVNYSFNGTWASAPLISDPLQPTSIDDDTRILYIGSGSSANISGLPLDSSYYFMVLEAQQSGSLNYLQSSQNNIIQTHIEQSSTGWQMLNRNLNPDGMKFLSKDTGFMHTNYGIARTMDGGNSWTFNRYFGAGGNYSSSRIFDNVFFPNSTTGFLINGNQLLKSTNRGLTWASVYSHDASIINMAVPDLNSLYMLSSENEIQTKVYKSINGGLNWIFLYSIPFKCFGISFSNANTGFISAENGSIYSTVNGGATWVANNLFVNCTLPSWAPIEFVTGQVGFFGDYCGNIYRTSDGGKSWQQRMATGAGKFFSIDFSDRLNGAFHGGGRFFYKTSNGGESFSLDSVKHHLVRSESSNGRISMPDPNVIIVRAGSAVLKTVSAGRNESIVLNNKFSGIICPDSSLDISYTLNGLYSGELNEVIAELSDSLGLFSSPTSIGKIRADTSGKFSARIPANISGSTKYRIRLRTTSPAVFSNISDTFRLIPSTFLSFNFIPDTLRSSDAVIALSGTPAGGTFYIDSIAGFNINPSSLKSGLHSLEYSYPTGTCTSSIFRSFFVKVPPTITFGNINLQSICSGKELMSSVEFKGTWDSSRIVNLQLSNSSGSFSNPVHLISINAVSNPSLRVTIPSNVSSGSGYRIRAITMDSAVISNISNAFSISRSRVPRVTIATPDTLICSGTSVLISTTILDAGSTSVYEWIINGGLVGVSTNSFSSNTFSNGDVVQLRVRWLSGCTLDSATLSNLVVIKVVRPTELPSVFSFEKFLYSNVSDSNQWLRNGQIINDATNQFYQPVSSGVFQVRIINRPCPVQTSGTLAFVYSGLYTFIGSGNWSNQANWQNGIMPPNPLPSGSSIFINPSGTAECILNVPQTINTGASLNVEPGKRFRVNGNLIVR